MRPTDGGPNFRGLLQVGNINQFNRPRIRNPDGSVSSVRSMSFDVDGREVLVPTAIPAYRDPTGHLTPAHVASVPEARRRYFITGRNLGVFDTPAHANAYAEWLHRDQAFQLGVDPGYPTTHPLTHALVRAGVLR